MTLRETEREDKFGDSKRISIKHALHAEHFFMCPLCSEGPETIIHALKKIATKPRFFGSLFLPFWQTLFSMGLTLLTG